MGGATCASSLKIFVYLVNGGKLVSAPLAVYSYFFNNSEETLFHLMITLTSRSIFCSCPAGQRRFSWSAWMYFDSGNLGNLGKLLVVLIYVML